MERLQDSISRPYMRNPSRQSENISAPAAFRSFSSTSTSISDRRRLMYGCMEYVSMYVSVVSFLAVGVRTTLSPICSPSPLFLLPSLSSFLFFFFLSMILNQQETHDFGSIFRVQVLDPREDNPGSFISVHGGGFGSSSRLHSNPPKQTLFRFHEVGAMIVVPLLSLLLVPTHLLLFFSLPPTYSFFPLTSFCHFSLKRRQGIIKTTQASKCGFPLSFLFLFFFSPIFSFFLFRLPPLLPLFVFFFFIFLALSSP